MAEKHVYLGDDQSNVIYPMVDSESILDKDKLLQGYALRSDILSLNAGEIKNGGNLNEVTDPGFHSIRGCDSSTIANLPPAIKESNLWATILTIPVVGITQIYIQGSLIVVRDCMGNPGVWSEWKFTVLKK